MKRKASTRLILTLLLALTLVLSSLLLTACTDEPTETVTVLYEERDFGIIITGYEGVLREDTELKIPELIGSEEVVAIADGAFEGKSDLRRIVIPRSVVAIGGGAFKNCKNLEYVNIPTGVTEISAELFSGCRSLKEVNMPDGITKIGENAFKGCDAVEHLTAHGWALSYFNLSSLRSLNIRGSLEVTKGMFADCKRLESITLPFVGASADASAETHLGFIFGAKDAAANASAIPSTLKKVVITGGKVIDDSAFSGATSITTVILPTGLETVGVDAFSGCTALSKVTIPATVKYIGDGAFAGTAIEEAAIPSAVSAIASGTFAGCASLKSVTLGKGVAQIAPGAFDGCIGLEQLRVDSVEQWLSFEFESCFDSPLYYAGKLFVGRTEAKNIVIPESITEIKDNAFYRCTSIESIALHGAVSSIGDYAFAGCTSLSGISFPESVKSIGTAAFSGCSSIRSLTLPESISSVGSYAFNLCTSLTTLEFNASVSKIEEAVFRATSLTSLTVSDSVSEVDGDAFRDTNKIKSVCAPACVIGAISTRSLESVSITSAEAIPASLLKDCTSLRSAVIGASVAKIGESAFAGCTSLSSVALEDGSLLTSIGRSAFLGCERLTSFVVGECVSEIGEGAFEGCFRLVEVYDLSDAITVTLGSDDCGGIGKNAFYVHASGDTPTAIIELGDYRFATLGTVTYLLGYFGENTVLTLPELVNGSAYSIFSLAFSSSDIRAITIPETVNGIFPDAFKGTTGIKELEASVSHLSGICDEARTSVETLTVNGVGAIEVASLYGYESLAALNVGADVYSIAPAALFEMEFLAQINVDAASTQYKSVDGQLYRLTSDGDVLVRACPATTDYFTLPTTVIEIGSYAFAGCKNLTNLYIEEGSVLRRIGELSFYGCEILYSLELPASIADIGANAFLSCSYLSEMEFGGECDRYSTVGGCLIDKAAKTVILCFGEDGVVTIPSDGSVTRVIAGALTSRKTVKALVLAKGVEYDEFAFGALPALETIEVASDDPTYKVVDGCLIRTATKELILATTLAKIPTDGSVTSITNTAFAGNTALVSIVIPDTVTSVAEGAFVGCESLVRVTTPLEFIGCFDGSTVTDLTLTGTGTLTAKMLEGYTALESLTVGDDISFTDGETVYAYSATEPEEDGSFYYVEGGRIVIW